MPVIRNYNARRQSPGATGAAGAPHCDDRDNISKQSPLVTVLRVVRRTPHWVRVQPLRGSPSVGRPPS